MSETIPSLVNFDIMQCPLCNGDAEMHARRYNGDHGLDNHLIEYHRCYSRSARRSWIEQARPRVVVIPEQLPFEDHEKGHYVHASQVPVVETRNMLTGETNWHVPVFSYMEMQKERDDLKRALSIINATIRGTCNVSITALLDKLGPGYTAEDAKAMGELIRQGREGFQ